MDKKLSKLLEDLALEYPDDPRIQEAQASVDSMLYGEEADAEEDMDDMIEDMDSAEDMPASPDKAFDDMMAEDLAEGAEKEDSEEGPDAELDIILGIPSAKPEDPKKKKKKPVAAAEAAEGAAVPGSITGSY